VTTHDVLSTILQESNGVNSGWENIRQTCKKCGSKNLARRKCMSFLWCRKYCSPRIRSWGQSH